MAALAYRDHQVAESFLVVDRLVAQMVGEARLQESQMVVEGRAGHQGSGLAWDLTTIGLPQHMKM